MAKIQWEISRAEYGAQFEVTASTRNSAIAQAEARFMADTRWEGEMVGQVLEGGGVFVRSTVPEYTAKKVLAH